MPWFFAVAERDHAIQNPTSPEKIRQLGELLRLRSESRVLDVACGRGGPAIILARAFGCRLVGLEQAPEFVAAARARIADASLGSLIDVFEIDAREFEFEPNSFDVALCLGATFIWGGMEGALEKLVPTVRPGGHVVVGEPFWCRWPLPDGIASEGFTNLAGTVDRVRKPGLAFVGLIAASEDDWDAYESLHWRALEEWLADNSDDPDADEVRNRHEDYRDRYLNTRRELLGWALFVASKKREKA